MRPVNIIIQKFGGTSVATREARVKAIEKIKATIEQGFLPVVVVSAIGRKGQPYATDSLLTLVESTEKFSMNQNKDLLLCCGELISAVVFADQLAQEGIEAVAMTGQQAGIITDDDFGNAKIIDLKPERIINHLHNGRLVVVAGFQGSTIKGDLTTLGRGGSDTTAAALGVALNAQMIEIYTDVEGIMTADPRIVPEAKMLESITYNELCHMAYQGAKVVHPRAVELAMSKLIPMRVRSTFSNSKGTLVVGEKGGKDMEERLITGIAYLSDITQIKVKADDTNSDKILLKLFKALADNEISVDFINIYPKDAVFTIKSSDTAKGESILHDMNLQYERIEHCAKVSVVGANMTGVPGVMAHIMSALVEENINILQTSDSYTTIWCLVKGEDLSNAVRALHKKFKLS